ncbi:MAG: FAD-dependent oxidoreductase [Chloroflexota bacterium]|nr:MAG: FAD-dependent oxidoreductase [Chloroflexota bacterium]
MSRPDRVDAVVVGGGHNGLVAAGYLARAGLRVLVLERRPTVGGTVETVTVRRGVRAPAVFPTVGRLRPSIVRDLRLRDHGLRLVAPAASLVAPQPDGPAVVLERDPEATAVRLGAFSAADAAGFLALDRRVRALERVVAALNGTIPPDLREPGLDEALAGLRLGRAFRGLGRRDGRALLRWLPMAIADALVDDVPSEPLRAALAWGGLRYAAFGPRSAGSTAWLLTQVAGTGTGLVGETVYARGGPGAVTEALAAAIRAFGGEIRTEAEVVRVTEADGRVVGVVLASGEEIRAPVVVSALDPKRTLLDLLDPVVVGPELRWRAGNLRTAGSTAIVCLVLRRLPRFPSLEAAGDAERLLRGRILVGAPSLAALETAFDASKYGRVSASPVLEATIPSLVDPSLVEGARAGTHVLHAVVQWAPRTLRAGEWRTERGTLLEAVVARLEAVAPGIGDLVGATRVVTPADIEAEYGLTGGHVLHVEPGLDAFFLWRPLLGWARYRLPVAGLYLAGPGAHPGGGVTGLPGRNAARAILNDLGRRVRPRLGLLAPARA